MTKPLDPEVKSLFAIARELKKHDEATQERMLAYFWAKVNDTTQDQVRTALRLVRRGVA
jgi:hypothetical protein